MVNLLEPEEVIGELWHRFAGERESFTAYPQAEVRYKSLEKFLPVLFRSLGGDALVRFAPSVASVSNHRLGFLQRLGRVDERVACGQATPELIILPDSIRYFPEAELNRDLYIWLAIFFSVAPPYSAPGTDDPLRRDLIAVRQAVDTAEKALAAFPGFRARYRKLAAATLAARKPRKLKQPEERSLEDLILALVSGRAPEGDLARSFWGYVTENHPLSDSLTAPRGYKPMLPNPLWGNIAPGHEAEAYTADDGEVSSDSADDEDDEQSLTRKARRQVFDQADRDDPFILYPFDGIVSWAEMLNLARTVEDEDEENAKKIADDSDEIVLSPNKKRAATKIRMSLDVPAGLVDAERLLGTDTYREWDYSTKSYLPDHCRVIAQTAAAEEDAGEKSDEARRMITRVRRQFEALRPKREILHRQLDGAELDMDAVIRAYADRNACGRLSDKIYMESRDQSRDLGVAILVDTSLSTDAWVENRQVIDVAKETLSVFANGLEACGDSFAVYTFTSRRRDQVFVNTLKDFDERMGETVERRVAAMRPGYYTRIGTAIRHVSDILDKRPNRHRLMLVITDGKPNDIDHYEGRYGIEDSRMAIREARQLGQTVYGVTIDKQAQDYFPHMFGLGNYSIVGHLGKLPAALPAIYRSLIA